MERGAALIRLLAVAPLDWSSGYDDLLLALRDVTDRGLDVELRVEADGPARDRFVYNVSDLDLGERVVLASATTEVDSEARADALVSAAVDDRPQPELVAASRRVDIIVATDQPWMRAQLVSSTRAVVLVPAWSPDELADALAGLVDRAGDGAP